PVLPMRFFAGKGVGLFAHGCARFATPAPGAICNKTATPQSKALRRGVCGEPAAPHVIMRGALGAPIAPKRRMRALFPWECRLQGRNAAWTAAPEAAAFAVGMAQRPSTPWSTSAYRTARTRRDFLRRQGACPGNTGDVFKGSARR